MPGCGLHVRAETWPAHEKVQGPHDGWGEGELPARLADELAR